ncbi:Membrane-bound lytic murein transglycosylase D [Gammaproteobacteria bacterium]|nr:LysM peptidoglycan-binding domain-containing protein [Gammaproteobacteria bacterium]CAG0942508.1 Membrane-bound lytic murein transglycosylase D [Gammaproteobacteria bacterium]
MSVVTRVLPALAAALLLFSAAAPAADEALPRPPGLAAEVAFWQRIFAECTSQQGLIHDNRHLGVVYEKIDATGEGSQARLQRLADTARARYERILRTLASGERSGLDAESARVLALWPANVSNAELRAAADRVRFQQGLAERFHAGLVRSGQWRDHIRESLREHGVPEGVAALPHVESSFDPNARSFVGAAGLWQFTGDTGKRFMRIDQAVDERRDPYESSEAAARLLRYNHDLLGTWPLAITAYNHGAAGMRRAVDSVGTTDIEAIIRRYDGPAFGFASRNFYVSFLAALAIEQDPERFFGPVQRQPPRQELVVEVPDFMRIDALEKAFGVPRSTLQAYNPALLPPVWDGAKYVPRGFRLRLPAGQVIDASPQQLLASIPSGQRFDNQVPDKMHKVKRGDTLSRIAAHYGTTVGKLAQANGLTPGARIRVGQSLKLPGRAVAVASTRAPPALPDTRQPAPAADSYLVQPGDSLAVIARRTGVSQRDLLAFNGLADANHVRSGSRLRLVPPAGAAPEPAATATVASSRPPAVAAGRPATVAPDLPALESPAQAKQPTGDAGGISASLADPSNYLVTDNDKVEVQAAETLSHYAGWLEVTPEDLRKANGWQSKRALVIGESVRLDFSHVSRETFLARRVAYHHDLQEDFFNRYRITDTTEHRLRRGESVWILASQKYKVPVWLLRQYNPTLDLDHVRPGTRVVFPKLERVALVPAQPATARVA